MAKKAVKKAASSKAPAAPPVNRRPYPRATLEAALQVPNALKEKNGGNAWPPDDVAAALNISRKNERFFYLAGSSRDFGLTEGSRDSQMIALTDLGRELVYAPTPEAEKALKLKAFLNVDIFRRVLEYYRGSNLPEMKYLGNTLKNEFGLHESTHEEFSRLFRDNCDYLEVGSGLVVGDAKGGGASAERDGGQKQGADTVTLAEPEKDTGLRCFVIMPFREREKAYAPGFFDEVLRSLIAPAGRKAGFTVTTANRQGSDVIQSTIVNDLLNADLVIADLTEHNPNVLFELGMRLAHDKPVALIRARGTAAIFDVDNMLRVFDYEPNLWATTVERDLPKLIEHIEGSWNNRDSDATYMKLLHRPAVKAKT